MRQIPHHARLSIIASIGSGLEYYSFVTYVMLTPYLSQLFFPHASPHIAIMQTLLIFAVGYLAAPIGGIGFAWLGDRLGRKVSFLIAIMLMATADISIGLLPTAISAGMIATLALVLLRFCQGLAQSAELPGAITFICEHAHPTQRGRQCGLLFMGVGLGAGLSTLVNYGVTHFLTTEQILSHGWRIPFLLGGGLALMGYMLRLHIEETPAFTQQTTKFKVPLWALLQSNPIGILQGIGLILFPACLVTFGLYLPTYLEQYFHYAASEVYLSMSVGFIISAFCLPLFGALSDQLGRRRMYGVAMIITLALLYGLFHGLYSQHFSFLCSFMLLYYVAITSMAGCYPVILAEHFPTNMRYTGVASSYTLAYTLAGLFPFAINKLLHAYQEPMLVLWVFTLLAALSIWATLRFKTPYVYAMAAQITL